ncbi:uncharacterized protein LOC126827515 [Patella vulgata]|uniref:uncharacterized protein LOC126827515 n=1 Tax=Patella vulgata TaxID=6465 RepID=UPI0024A95F62|nr:uncharacterized protein LOC126827515 [Patella vulgata]
MTTLITLTDSTVCIEEMTATTATLTVNQLLQLKDDEFETTIKDMGQRNLMDMITGLQKEMAKEQENFNSMSEELKGFKDKNSRQYKQISKDLMSSQTRLTSLMNRSMKCFAQVNGVQSSLQNGDLESKQRGVVSQPLNIRGNKNVANVRPVSVVDARETTPQGQSVNNMVQKAHSVQNLNLNTSDSPVKTTLNVSFGDSSKKTNGVTVNNMVVNRQIENKNPENRHSWFGQQGGVSNETQKKLSDNQTSSTTNINITPQANKNTDRKINVKSASKTELSQNNGKQNDEAGATSQKLNITTVSSTVTSQSDSDDKKLRPINIKKGNQSGLSNGDVEEDDVLVVTPRMNLMSWNPIKLLKKLYHVKLIEETDEDISYKYVSMEGYMEKLPMNKKKATLLKTWKRRYFQAKDGWIHYFESGNRDKPSDSVQLMGGKILEMTDLGSKILGIDDGRGRFLMVRVPTDKEYGQWLLALESQTLDNTKACYVQPVLTSIPHPKKKVLVIDMGSSAIRAGLLGEHASLPQMFFPCTAAVNKTNGDIVIGVDAYHPDVRCNSNLIHPVHPSNKIDKESIAIFTIDWKAIKIIFQKIIQELKINPSQYWVMLSTPQSLGDNLKEGLMNILIDDLHTCGVCMVQQSLLSLYSYKATSGIIVDIGQRIEILPIFDGFVIEGGVSRLPYGSQKILDSLIISLLENNYSFSSSVEQLIVKYIMEQSCFVANNYKNELENCKAKDNKILTSVKLDDIDLPPTAYKEVKFDEGRFKSPEGLFDTDMWEMDYPNLHKLIFQAIQACPMDSRRHMYRAIYLSGGVTMLPGFADRFRTELTKLAPPGVPIEVHASQNRYHAAYIGACSVAGMAEFEMMCISREEWMKEGKKSFRKWKAPTL